MRVVVTRYYDLSLTGRYEKVATWVGGVFAAAVGVVAEKGRGSIEAGRGAAPAWCAAESAPRNPRAWA